MWKKRKLWLKPKGNTLERLLLIKREKFLIRHRKQLEIDEEKANFPVENWTKL